MNNIEDIKIQYLEAIKKEIILQKNKFSLKKEKIYTIYFGGGTPSEFGLENIFDLYNFIEKEFDLSELKEFSFELNPKLSNNKNIEETTNFIKKLDNFLSMKGNFTHRFSIGIQSLDNDILNQANRNYKFEDILQLLNGLKKIKKDFLSFNLDFISFGLEDDLYFQKFNNFVKGNTDVVDSYSIYTLELFPGSIWYQKVKNIDEKILDNFEKYLYIVNKHNYERYEISNFAKKGKESKHNQVYWEMGNYLGLGTSASGFITNPKILPQSGNPEIILKSGNNPAILPQSCNPAIRYTNSYGIQKYLKGIFELKEEKKLTKNELLQEYIFLGLRTNKGINLNNETKKIINNRKLEEFVKENYIIKNGDNIKLANKGLNVYNYIITELIDF